MEHWPPGWGTMGAAHRPSWVPALQAQLPVPGVLPRLPDSAPPTCSAAGSGWVPSSRGPGGKRPEKPGREPGRVPRPCRPGGARRRRHPGRAWEGRHWAGRSSRRPGAGRDLQREKRAEDLSQPPAKGPLAAGWQGRGWMREPRRVLAGEQGLTGLPRRVGVSWVL